MTVIYRYTLNRRELSFVSLSRTKQPLSRDELQYLSTLFIWRLHYDELQSLLRALDKLSV